MKKNKSPARVFVYGGDAFGWSVDKDRSHLETALGKLGFVTTRSIVFANLVYAVWWNQLLSRRFAILRLFNPWAKIICVITNDITQAGDDLRRIIRKADLFVCANSSQRDVLLSKGVPTQKIKHDPYFVSPNEFYNLNCTRDELASELKIDPSRLKGRILVGSFQRDSLNSDLSKPKWQKDPELLAQVMSRLPKDRFTLVLAGPRRHYLVSRCKELEIDYVFVGDASAHSGMTDDVNLNILGHETINKLYNLVDIYLVSSKSEGGPKAIAECGLTETPVVATRVGLAPDVVCADCLFENADEGSKILANIDAMNPKKLKEFFDTTKGFYSEPARLKRLQGIMDAAK